MTMFGQSWEGAQSPGWEADLYMDWSRCVTVTSCYPLPFLHIFYLDSVVFWFSTYCWSWEHSPPTLILKILSWVSGSLCRSYRMSHLEVIYTTVLLDGILLESFLHLGPFLMQSSTDCMPFFKGYNFSWKKGQWIQVPAFLIISVCPFVDLVLCFGSLPSWKSQIRAGQYIEI